VAVQAVPERQDTLARKLSVPRLGLNTTDQLVPFQDSIRVLPASLRMVVYSPAAVQAVADGQDTLARELSIPRLGLGTTDQLVPFQDSIRVLSTLAVLVVEAPVAVQAVAEGQDTLARELSIPRLGLGTTDQLAPFHDSIRVLVVLAPLGEGLAPVAVQAVADGQDTLAREPVPGLGTTDQLAPFQDSIRVLLVLAPEKPTAVHSVAETHDTPSRTLTWIDGLGLGTTDQLAPFHDSIRVLLVPAPVPEEPTAVQTFAETHDTLASELSDPGLGLGTTDQLAPFHDSIRVAIAPPGRPTESPAAVHAVAETHDTPSRRLTWADGLGLSTTDQVRVCAPAGAPAASNTSPASTAPAGSLLPASRKRRVRRPDLPVTRPGIPMANPCL
jgi:hypothetical protein